MQLKDGTLLYEGKYRIIRLISSGDFGYTYETLCARNDSKVAVRELYLRNCCERHPDNDEVSASSLEKVELFEKMKKRFIDEAKSLFQFDHPNIVRLSDVFLQNGTAYYAMDFIEGKTLQQIVQQKGWLTENEALGYMDQLCDAIDYVHSKSRLHLDIRPANAIVSSAGHLTLMDFGFSKRLDPTELDPNNAAMSSLNIATNSYSPIELSVESDATISPVSDVYSFGATLYKLLTGNTPPDAAMLMDYPLGELPEDISPNVAEAIRRAMSPNKADRPQSAREFKAMLHSPVQATASAQNTNPYASGDEANYQGSNGSRSSGTDLGGSPYNNNGNNSTDHFSNGYLGDDSTCANSMNAQGDNTLEDDEATFVIPNAHQGSEISQIDFHFDSVTSDDQTEIDSDSPGANGIGNGNNGANGTNGNTGYGTGSSTGSNQGHWGSIPSGGNGGSSSSSTHSSRSSYSGGNTLDKAKWIRIAAIVAAVLLLCGVGYWAFNYFSSSPSTPAGSTAIVEAVPGTTLGAYAQNNPELMGELNGHYWVDLGLPSGTKWATTNVGASTPMEFGGYYAWGETEGKSVYNYENAATYEKPMGEIGGNATFDVASKQWGEAWRLPTKAQYEELLKNCSYRWVEIDDVKGGLFTSRKNGQSIFLPAAGFRYGVITSDTDASYVGMEGAYWTDTPAPNDQVQENAVGLRLYGNSIQTLSDKFHRGAGRSVRAVAK